MTGAGGELGRATAEILADAGYTVAGVDRPRDSSAPPADAVSIDVVSAASDNRIAELMVRNRQVAERVSGVIARDRFWRASRSWTGVLRGPRSCVGLDVLHNNDDLPVRTLRDRVPDRQAVRRKVETVGTWQRVYLGNGSASAGIGSSSR